LKAAIPTVDQNSQGLTHQLSTLSSRFGLDFPETRIGMFVIPVFQDIKHLDGALQESCAALGTGHYMNHGWPPSCDGWIATASQKDTQLPQIRQIHLSTVTDSFALYPSHLLSL
jgi:hypothetical protein